MAVALASLAMAPIGHAAPLPAAPRCEVFPETNVWNTPVDRLPVAGNSGRLIRGIGVNDTVHPDFSSRGRFGIPINIATPRTPRQRVRFRYAGESDHVPYPIPRRPRIEGGSDRHILIVDRDRCRLYELFDARRVNGRWTAGSGATWNLRSNALRPRGWTSADAAGLPILPGLVRYSEVRSGEIDHALRFTASRTRRSFIYPARHFAGSSMSATLPPMGLRVRLKRSVSLRGHGPQARVVIRALKRYGMILADNGSPWFITGAPHARWNDDDLRTLKRLRGRDFEVVDTRRLRNGR
ncbi:MAG: hypothetical protein ACR2N6_04075 [Miltoncostaeaceae bacterium]